MLLLAAFAFYGYTLRLDWSLIDDFRLLSSENDLDNVLSDKGLGAGLASIFNPTENLAGPTMKLAVYIQWKVLGTHPFLWHLVKILSFFALSSGMFHLTRTLTRSTVAGLMAALYLGMAAPISSSPDFQTFHANYARLFVTDSYLAPLAMWTMATCVSLWIDPQGRRIERGIGVCVLALAAGLTKSTGMYILAGGAAMLVVRLLVALLTQSNRMFYFAVLAGWMIACLPSLYFFRPWNPYPVYGYDGVDIIKDPALIFTNARFYFLFALESFPLLALFLPFGLLIQLGRFVKGAVCRDPSAWAESAPFCVLGFFLSALLLQSMWPIIMPRYTLTFIPAFIPLGAGLIWRCIPDPKFVRANLFAVFMLTAAGLLAWYLAAYLYYHDFQPNPHRQTITVCSLLALSVILIVCLSWGMIANTPPRWVSRLGWGLSVSGFLWGAFIAALHTYEEAANYWTYEQTYSGVLQQGRQMDAPGANGQVTVYSNMRGEQAASSLGAGTMLLHLKNSRINFIGKTIPELKSGDRFYIIHDYLIQGVSQIPQLSGGFKTTPLTECERMPDEGPLDIPSIRDLATPGAFPAWLSSVALPTRMSGWTADVDVALLLTIDDKAAKELALFRGRDMRRDPFWQEVVSLKEPVWLPEGSHVALQTRFADPNRTPGRPADSLVILPLVSQINGVAIAPQPQILLFGSREKEPYLDVVERRQYTATNYYLASPVFLLLKYGAGQIPANRLATQANRMVKRTLIVEIMKPKG